MQSNTPQTHHETGGGQLVDRADWKRQAEQHLARFRPPHVDKKRATVLALVEARLAGVSEETVWGRPETCSRSIYHGKWRREPLFSDVLEHVTGLAREWQSGLRLASLEAAAERLALFAPDAVDTLIQLLDERYEPRDRRQAAVALLDRADVKTALKGFVALDVTTLSDEELDAIVGRGRTSTS